MRKRRNKNINKIVLCQFTISTELDKLHSLTNSITHSKLYLLKVCTKQQKLQQKKTKTIRKHEIFIIKYLLLYVNKYLIYIEIVTLIHPYTLSFL